MHRRRFVNQILSQFNTAEMKHAVRWPLAQEQRNYAVAVEEKASSDASEIKKSPKRVSKNERRSMVESFVNNYRAMNSGNFPTPSLVQKEVGGSYYCVKYIVQELQCKPLMPSTSTRNDDAKLYGNSGKDTIKNADVATNEEGRPHADMEEKPLLNETSRMPTMASKTTKSVKKNKLANEDGPMSALNKRTSSDEFVTRTLGTKVEFKEVGLTAHKVDGQALPLHYQNFAEEIEKSSITVESSADTVNDRYLLKEEDNDSHSATRISEDNVREETTSKIDQQRQSSDVANDTRDIPEDYAKKPFKWSLKSLADGLMRIWRRS